jgi:hypothetical protein
MNIFFAQIGDIIHKKSCSEYTAMVYNQETNKIFKNKYCAYCHNETDSSLKCHYTRSYGMRDNLQILFDVSSLFSEESASEILAKTKISVGKESGKIEESPIEMEEDLSEKIKKYMTIVGMFISIVSIIALLAIYAMNKTLRNFPGKLLICLSLSILLSQVTFLVSTYITEPTIMQQKNSTGNFSFKRICQAMCNPCYIFGSLTHFFYLGKYIKRIYNFYRQIN